MPRQEHLPQASGAVPCWRGLQRARARLAALIRRAGLLVACLFVFTAAHGAPTDAATPLSRSFDQVEAVRSDWNATSPPSGGWTTVTLPDNWATRWPGFDGVVWYRLRWTEAADVSQVQPLGLMVEYVNMAGAMYLNGSLIGRDTHLAEPLSRSWNMPRHWLLDAPLLRPGTNELLVRVSGMSAYQPGLGAVSRGEPALVKSTFRQINVMQRTLQLVGIGLTLVMGIVYGMLWLLRRAEVSYGWFSLFSLLWVLFSYNFVAVEAWPFASTDAFQRANHVTLLASLTSFFLFALHFCDLAGRRLQWSILAVGGACIATLILAPQALQEPVRSATVLGTLAIYLGGCALIVRHAFRSRRMEVAVLALCLMLPVVAAAHDTLVFLQWLPGNRYYAPLSASATLLGISFALTWRMVKGLRLVENFNAELRQRVDEATRRLADGLSRQHAAELVQTRLTERLSLVRDLHDGLGMTLSSHIHTLGNREGEVDGVALWALKEVNDDLRLIIESSAFDDTDELAERLVPVRHRSTRLLEAANIECHWSLEGLETCQLTGKRGLDFLRVLQEALANVLKHSCATRVDIRIDARQGQLALSIRDNGQGFAPDAASRSSAGMGLKNMHARAARLGGTLDIRSGTSGTTMELRCPIEAAVVA
ncbi:7TM diverse intracellular signaling domain-containing protein [Variovorax sp. J2P1-59]|uniref:sensor histidine kinase n=1 Tax=Variovorax flavidus TaxID=3053501 RepID=UPI0025771CBB|nr:ATP-binding protein [Variovorax sp. J2P1-59]MDM0076863.1 7TM diverse intracellular signaling domain-containing protein [Variovorax sp. J2P1-59]